MLTKELVLTKFLNGNPRIIRKKDFDELSQTFANDDFKSLRGADDDDGYVPDQFPPRLWELILNSDLNFSVLHDMRVIIHLDVKAFGDLRFAKKFERPPGTKLRHWTDKAMSIDDARDKKGALVRPKVPASKYFVNGKFTPKTIQFDYEGPSRTGDMNTGYSDDYRFVYDLYLEDPSSARNNRRLWIDPIIVNDGEDP